MSVKIWIKKGRRAIPFLGVEDEESALFYDIVEIGGTCSNPNLVIGYSDNRVLR